ncbi:MAG: hypothetical protein II676_00395 [Bacteroidales bacterium]|nr:hypothetical protein [Bacteroidales bacterium]
MRTLTPDKEKEINVAVSRWLKSRGIKQREAAERLGVSLQCVSNQLSTRHFTKRSARIWSAEFGLSEKFLLSGVGPICARQTTYQKMVSESESLHGIVKSQKRTISDLVVEVERYRNLYGPLPAEAQSIVS